MSLGSTFPKIKQSHTIKSIPVGNFLRNSTRGIIVVYFNDLGIVIFDNFSEEDLIRLHAYQHLKNHVTCFVWGGSTALRQPNCTLTQAMPMSVSDPSCPTDIICIIIFVLFYEADIR